MNTINNKKALREAFKKETGRVAVILNGKMQEIYRDEYCEWLENRLIAETIA